MNKIIDETVVNGAFDGAILNLQSVTDIMERLIETDKQEYSYLVTLVNSIDDSIKTLLDTRNYYKNKNKKNT